MTSPYFVCPKGHRYIEQATCPVCRADAWREAALSACDGMVRVDIKTFGPSSLIGLRVQCKRWRQRYQGLRKLFGRYIAAARRGEADTFAADCHVLDREMVGEVSAEHDREAHSHPGRKR